MAATPKRIQEITIDRDSFTGRDWRDIGRALGVPVTQKLTQDPPLELVYAMAWVVMRRAEPDLTYDDVLDMPMGDLPKMNARQAPDPKAPRLAAVAG
jgi:hypothetical protein